MQLQPFEIRMLVPQSFVALAPNLAAAEHIAHCVLQQLPTGSMLSSIMDSKNVRKRAEAAMNEGTKI